VKVACEGKNKKAERSGPKKKDQLETPTHPFRNGLINRKEGAAKESIEYLRLLDWSFTRSNGESDSKSSVFTTCWEKETLKKSREKKRGDAETVSKMRGITHPRGVPVLGAGKGGGKNGGKSRRKKSEKTLSELKCGGENVRYSK